MIHSWGIYQHQLQHQLQQEHILGNYNISTRSVFDIAWFRGRYGTWLFLVGPFALLGPLRNSSVGLLAAFMSAAGLIIILSVGLAIYGNATFTAADKAEGIQSKKGWQEFNGGFTIGAFGGAAFAYFLLTFVK